MTRREKARELFLAGYNCSQAVFCAFADLFEMDEQTAFALTSSLGGGMGGLREVCGACSGMFLAAGLLVGPRTVDADAKKAHYALVQGMAEQFAKENKTIICRELLASHGIEGGSVPLARTAGYYKERPCLKYVEDAAEIAEKALAVQ